MNLEDEDLKVALVMLFVIFSVIFSYQNIKSKKIISKAPNEEAKKLKISFIPSLAAAIAGISMLFSYVVICKFWNVKAEGISLEAYLIIIGVPTLIFYLFNKKYNLEYIKLIKIVKAIDEFESETKYQEVTNEIKLNNKSEKQIISKLNQKSTLSDEEKQIISKIKAKKTREFWFTVGVIILAVVIVYLQLA